MQHSLFETYGPMFLLLAVASLLASLFFVGATCLGPQEADAEKMPRSSAAARAPAAGT